MVTYGELLEIIGYTLVENDMTETICRHMDEYRGEYTNSIFGLFLEISKGLGLVCKGIEMQAFPLGAMHPLALCEPPRSNLHSLADEQARRLASFDYLLARNLISEYFDTMYLRSWSVANSLPLAICHCIVLSE